MQTIYNCLLLYLPTINKLRVKYENNVLILVSIGSYYLCIGEDTDKIKELLNIEVVTYSGQQITAFDYRDLDEYLPKLVKAGHRVALWTPNK